MNRLLLFLVCLLLYPSNSFSQVQISMNQKIVKTDLIPISEEAYTKFKNSKTVIILNKELIQYKDDILQLVKQVWNITPLRVDSLQNIDKYKLIDEYSFLSINASILNSNKSIHQLTSYDINISWDLWMYGEKGEKFEIMLAKIPCVFNIAEIDFTLHQILNNNPSISQEKLIQKINESSLGMQLFFPPLTYFYFKKIQETLAPNVSEYFSNYIKDETELKKLDKESTLLFDKKTCFYTIDKINFAFYSEMHLIKPYHIKNNYSKPYMMKTQGDLINSYYSDNEFYYYHHGYYNKFIYYFVLDGKKNEIIYFNSTEDELKLCVPKISVLEVLKKEINKSK